MDLNPVLAELGPSPMVAVQERARALRDAGEPLVDFSIGDPREPTPPFIPEALKSAVPEISQYPTVAGLARLREAIAGYIDRRFGVSVDPDTQIVPTSGAKEAIFTTPLAFIDRTAGDAIVFGTPGYQIYERGGRFAGAEAIGVRLGGDFVLRAGDVPADAWGRARMLWLCTPHNPAGSVTAAADLDALVATARSAGVLLCSDECYADLYEGDTPPSSVLQAAGDGAGGVLAFMSLSKRSGMTGYRSAAIVGDPRAIAAIKRLRSSIGVAQPEFIQEAAVAAWSDDVHTAERRAIFAEKRRVLRAAFDDLGYEVVGSSAGIYLWVRVGDDAAVTARLLDSGVVAAPGSAFGPGGEGFIRFALVPTVDQCHQAVEVLRTCLTQI